MDNRIITTSWDDGHPLDIKLASLLQKYNLAATFYIPKSNTENPVMSEKEIINLGRDFEIGGHTLRHKDLTKLSETEAVLEVNGCKKWLQDLLGSSIDSFCYPKGQFNLSQKKIVKEAGFKYARAVELLSTNLTDKFAASTTLQIYNHSMRIYFRNALYRKRIKNLYYFCKQSRFSGDVVKATEYYINKINRDGGIYHLWGHSWEIERYNLWDDLESLFKMISNLKGFHYCRNGELLKYV